jgi:hypothetical protein
VQPTWQRHGHQPVGRALTPDHPQRQAWRPRPPIETEDSSASAGSLIAASGAAYGGPFPNETEDASANDATSEAVADATDASETGPTDSASVPDVPSSTPPYGQGPIPGDE